MYANNPAATLKDVASSACRATTRRADIQSISSSISTTKQHKQQPLSASSDPSSNHAPKLSSIWESRSSRTTTLLVAKISALHHKVIQITPPAPTNRLNKSSVQRYREPVVVHHWRLHVDAKDQHLRSRSRNGKKKKQCANA